MPENVTALLLLYIRPVAAISKILDHGRLWFAILAAVLVSVALHTSDMGALVMAEKRANPKASMVQEQVAKQADRTGEQPEAAAEPPSPTGFVGEAVARFASYDPWSFFSAIWAIAVAMVPGIIVIRAATGYGSLSVLFRRDYLSLLMCALLCWSAVYLVVAVAQGIVSYGSAGRESIHVIPVFAVAALYFLGLIAIAVRTVLGTTLGAAAGLSLGGAAVAIAGAGLFGVAGAGVYFLASPLVLFYVWRMFGSEMSSLGDGLRGRQHFQQQMQIATTNPRDADAHYQLGLVYQQRRQYTEAVARFQRAIEIDPSEPDAQFQLGRIARKQGRFDDAIRYLTAAAALNDKLLSSEVWRELGAAYFGASRFEEADAALKKYTGRHPYDPEGLYWYGKTLAALGKFAEARETFAQCVEAVDTMPKHRRAQIRKWKGLAKTELSAVAARS